MIIINFNIFKQRIDNFLIKKLKRTPKSLIYKMIRIGKIKVNNKKTYCSFRLNKGDKILIPRIYNSLSSNIKDSKLCLHKAKNILKFIIYEDKYVLIFNKPSGLAVHSGSGLSFGVIELIRFLNTKNRFFELIHRIDRYTSGILLIAKKRSFLHSLHEQLRLNKIKKTYLALLKGYFKSKYVTFSNFILKKKNTFNKVVNNLKGKKYQFSKTHFFVKEQFRDAAFVKIIPITGRTHQIRIHSKCIGHPIAFDNIYGEKIFNKYLENYYLKRLFLHSYSLRFYHPGIKKNFFIKAPMDNNLIRCLLLYRKKMFNL